MRLGELCSSNPLRIPHPKIDKLACQAQGVGIFAAGEITLHDAYCILFVFAKSEISLSFRALYFITLAPFCQAFIQKIARSY